MTERIISRDARGGRGRGIKQDMSHIQLTDDIVEFYDQDSLLPSFNRGDDHKWGVVRLGALIRDFILLFS